MTMTNKLYVRPVQVKKNRTFHEALYSFYSSRANAREQASPLFSSICFAKVERVKGIAERTCPVFLGQRIVDVGAHHRIRVCTQPVEAHVEGSTT